MLCCGSNFPKSFFDQASQDKNKNEVGANLFIGNLDVDVEEKLLYDTFSAFGVIISTPKVYIILPCLASSFRVDSLLQNMRDPDTGNSRGFGFVNFDSFEASDAAIEVLSCRWFRSVRFLSPTLPGNEQPVPLQSSHFRWLCVQEGHQGGAARQCCRYCFFTSVVYISGRKQACAGAAAPLMIRCLL